MTRLRFPDRSGSYVSAAFGRTGIDFRAKGPRAAPTKTLANTALPTGVTVSNGTLRVPSGQLTLFEGWDFTGASLFLSTGSVILRDCYVPNGASPCLDVRGTAVVAAEFCDFDGIDEPGNPFSLIFQPSDDSRFAIRDSRIHSGGSDCVHISSNSILERNYIYNAGASPTAHPDGIQFSTEPGTHANIVVRQNLIVGNGPGGINNLIRCVAEKQPNREGAVISNVLIEGNVCVMPNEDTIHTPLSIGRRTSAGQEGLGLSDITVASNWLHYFGPGANLGDALPTGLAQWTNNRRLDTGTLIPPPTGWSA